jgi:hypothetical protein
METRKKRWITTVITVVMTTLLTITTVGFIDPFDTVNIDFTVLEAFTSQFVSFGDIEPISLGASPSVTETFPLKIEVSNHVHTAPGWTLQFQATQFTTDLVGSVNYEMDKRTLSIENMTCKRSDGVYLYSSLGDGYRSVRDWVTTPSNFFKASPVSGSEGDFALTLLMRLDVANTTPSGEYYSTFMLTSVSGQV